MRSLLPPSSLLALLTTHMHAQVSHKSNVRLADNQDARLQYLSWRVWGMKRRHATVELQRATEGDLEDSELSDTRSEEMVVTSPTMLAADAEAIADLVRSGPSPALPRLTVQPASATAAAAEPDVYDNDDRDNLFSPVAPGSPVAGEVVVHTTLTAERVPKLYCVLISMHGLVRGDAMELGKDPDTGGQVREKGKGGGGGESRWWEAVVGVLHGKDFGGTRAVGCVGCLEASGSGSALSFKAVQCVQRRLPAWNAVSVPLTVRRVM